MRIEQSCAECLYDKQVHLTDNPAYLSEIKEILDKRGENDTAPYLVYQFSKVYERYFGRRASYAEVKMKFNDLVLTMEDEIRRKIQASHEPFETALAYARVGNYIDYGAMNQVDEDTFLALFQDAALTARDRQAVDSFKKHLARAKTLLLITDNCGEIVLDKLFLEEAKRQYPNLEVWVLVRGEEVLNDATVEDAIYVGMQEQAKVISNGSAVAGTVYEMLPTEARTALDTADVILAKGQGNYESLCNQGRHIFYSFLCKCDLFTKRFSVPALTGMFVEE